MSSVSTSCLCLSTMDSIIELQRQTHEEVEHLERALYTTLSKSQSTHEVRLQNEHKASQLLDRIHSRVVTLSNLYGDQDTRKAEMDALSAPARQDDLSAFYGRLGKIQEHHAKYPDSTVGGFELELAAFMDEAEELDDDEYEQDDRECLTFYAVCQMTSKRDLSYVPIVLRGRGVWKVPRPLC